MRNIDSNIKHPDYWDEMEKRQQTEIEELGLVVDFKHNRSTIPSKNKKGDMVGIPLPRKFEGYDDRYYTDITGAYLYTPKEAERLKKFRQEHPDNESNAYTPEAVGRAYCSHLDNFNRQIGRVIATERALANLQK